MRQTRVMVGTPNYSSAIRRLTAANLALQIGAVITGPILARRLGPYDRGILASVLAPVNLAIALFAVGIPTAMTYFVASRALSPRRAQRLAVALGSVTGLAATSIVWILAPYLLRSEEGAVPLLRAGSLTLIGFGAAAAIRGVRLGSGRFGLVSREQWIGVLTRVIAIAGFAIVGILTVTSAAWISIGSTLAASTILVWGWRTAPRSLDAGGSETRLRSVLAYSGSVAVGAISGTVITRLDQTLMPTLSGARQLGFYAVAVSVSEIPLFMSIAVRDVVLTASTARADFRLVADAARAVLLSQIVLAAAAALVAPWLVPWVFGAQFAGSVPSVLVLLFGGALGSAGSVLNQGLLSLNAPLIRSLTLAATAVVAIVTLLVLAPEFGALGASLASACAYVSSSLLNALAFSKKAGVSVRDCLVPRPADGQRVASLVAATTTRLRRGRKNPLKR